MENDVLTRNRIVVIKDPTALPEGAKHDEAIDALARANKVVILLSHGNKYHLPPDYVMPHNVSTIQYDLDMQSIQRCVLRLREILREHGVQMYSRHLDDDDPMPILLGGACITMNAGTELAFVNKPEKYIATKEKLETPVSYEETEWDLT